MCFTDERDTAQHSKKIGSISKGDILPSEDFFSNAELQTAKEDLFF
jgi:hypothetical protein